MNNLVRVCALGLTLLPASALDYNFQVRAPGESDFDLSDLDHRRSYEWEVRNFDLPGGLMVTGATLTFNNMWDWQVEEDFLYLTLLDDPSSTATRPAWEQFGPTQPTRPSPFRYQSRLIVVEDNAADNAGDGDDFLGEGTSIATWSDPLGGVPTTDDVVINFTAEQVMALRRAIQDNNFALGLDPDCHYFNDGVVFTIHTDVPDASGTLALLSLGMACMFGYGLVPSRLRK